MIVNAGAFVKTKLGPGDEVRTGASPLVGVGNVAYFVRSGWDVGWFSSTVFLFFSFLIFVIREQR